MSERKIAKMDIVNSLLRKKIVLKTVLLLLFGLFFNINLFSQGFDWQFSTRFPNPEPKFFIGINSEYGLANSFGDIPYNEGSFSCCKFENGRGSIFAFGLSGEYWYDGLFAVNASINYKNVNTLFSNQRKIPRREYMLVTNYELDASANFINTNIYVKRRIFNSNFFGGIGVDLNVFLSKSLYFQELKDAQTPKDDPFQNRYNISSAEISDFNIVNCGVNLLFGYDLSISDGYYISSAIGLNLPMFSLLSDSDWRILGAKLKVSILRKL